MSPLILHEGDDVRLLHDEPSPDGVVPAGTIGLVAEVFDSGLAGEIEIVDDAGYTTALIHGVPAARLGRARPRRRTPRRTTTAA
jgi:phage head maturation protease